MSTPVLVLMGFGEGLLGAAASYVLQQVARSRRGECPMCDQGHRP